MDLCWQSNVFAFKYAVWCCCWVSSVVSNSVQPRRRQLTRLLCPWDSPGKNTGVGCHFPFQCMKVKSESEVTQPCPTLSDPMDWSLPGSSVHGIFQARVLEWGAIAFSGNSVLEPENRNYWSPCAQEPVLCNRKPLQWKARVPQLARSPRPPSNGAPAQPKTIKQAKI